MLKKFFLAITISILAILVLPTPTFAAMSSAELECSRAGLTGSAYTNCVTARTECSELTGSAYTSCIETVNDRLAGSSATTDATTDDCRTFLGMTSWDCGTNLTNGNPVTENTLKSGIWTAVANVATDITIIAAYLVIGYVIYGGYLYVFSAGDPGKTMNGKKTLSRAFIGLAIVMSANLIMSTIRFALLGANGTLGYNCVTATCISPDRLVLSTIHWFIAIAGIVSTIFVVYGGISYTTSTGDPSKLKKAKDMILYACIGLVICALAEIITSFVSGIIRNANSAAITNETIISKEVYENKIY